MSTDTVVFWAAVCLLIYIYAGYPLILYIWAKLNPRSYLRNKEYEPSVSILVVAHNEAANVSERLDNLLALDYPRHRLEIILASDGSTDDTVTLARRYVPQGVSVFEFGIHRGKPAVLNELVPLAKGNIIVLADMRQRFEPTALRALVAPFVDIRIGAVTGELILTGDKNGSAAGEGVGFYWKYEKFIRRQETMIDSTVGVTGAIYAMRRSLFSPIASDTLIDDVLIPMNIVRQGYRVVYEPTARAHDRKAVSTDKEFARKVRTIAGNYQLLLRHAWLLNPFLNRLWWQTISHKYCRLLSPPCLVLALAANYRLLHLPEYQLLFVLQVIFYVAAYFGYVNEALAKTTPFISVPYTFCLLNWATVVALFRFISGRQHVTWNREPETQ